MSAPIYKDTIREIANRLDAVNADISGSAHMLIQAEINNLRELVRDPQVARPPIPERKRRGGRKWGRPGKDSPP